MKYSFIKDILLPLCIMTMLNSKAQPKNLEPGDKVPDIELENIFNYSHDKLKLSDYRGKLVILDFWSTSCTGCIKGFAHLDTLQKLFGDKIQILLVNEQSRDSTARFFKNRQKIKKPGVPFITGDSILNALFPWKGVDGDFLGLPYHIWIDKDGVVKYMAGSWYATEENIQKVLDGFNPPIEKRQSNVYPGTLFDERWKGLLENYSYLSRCKIRLRLDGLMREGYEILTYPFQSVTQLYQIAYDSLTRNRYRFSTRPGITFVKANDLTRYFVPKTGQVEWWERYAFNYQLCLPEEKKEKRSRMMKEDLDRYFDLTTRIEKKKIKCVVMVRTGKSDRLKSKGGAWKDTWDDSGIVSTKADSISYLNNYSFELFSQRLGSNIEHFLKLPFIDQTGYKGNADIALPDKVLDSLYLPDLRKALSKYGISLIEKYCLLDVLVLEEKNIKPIK